jgi:tRNA pseudouridine55 synthase
VNRLAGKDSGGTRRLKRAVTGILLLDKPAGISSNIALQRVRRAFAAAKGGHTGNLDVAATGLLPLCFGEATKVSGFLLDADKVYVADIALGATTTTGDREGEVLCERSAAGIEQADVEGVLTRFLGEIAQVPPMYSALKRDGRPLYEYARAGIELERAARRVRIYSLRLLAYAPGSAHVEVHCSKGTYIRTLAEDIGEALGCGAHLAALRRTRAGPFSLDDAHPLARFQAPLSEPGGLDALLLPVDSALGAFPLVTLESTDAERALAFGQAVAVANPPLAGLCRVYARSGRFLGMGEIDGAGTLAPRRMMQTASEVPDQHQTQ